MAKNQYQEENGVSDGEQESEESRKLIARKRFDALAERREAKEKVKHYKNHMPGTKAPFDAIQLLERKRKDPPPKTPLPAPPKEPKKAAKRTKKSSGDKKTKKSKTDGEEEGEQNGDQDVEEPVGEDAPPKVKKSKTDKGKPVKRPPPSEKHSDAPESNDPTTVSPI